MYMQIEIIMIVASQNNTVIGTLRMRGPEIDQLDSTDFNAAIEESQYNHPIQVIPCRQPGCQNQEEWDEEKTEKQTSDVGYMNKSALH